MFFLAAPVVSSFPWAEALDRARDVAGLKDDAIAHLMGISRVQYSQQKHGQGHLSLRRLSMLAKDRDGLVMLKSFATEWAAFHGVSDLELAGEWLRGAIASFTRLRMAKATLTRETREIRKTA